MHVLEFYAHYGYTRVSGNARLIIGLLKRTFTFSKKSSVLKFLKYDLTYEKHVCGCVRACVCVCARARARVKTYHFLCLLVLWSTSRNRPIKIKVRVLMQKKF
jgi:hypothetical protein